MKIRYGDEERRDVDKGGEAENKIWRLRRIMIR